MRIQAWFYRPQLPDDASWSEAAVAVLAYAALNTLLVASVLFAVLLVAGLLYQGFLRITRGL